MRRWYNDNYEDGDENPRVWAHHHHVIHGPLQPNHDYGAEGIEQHTIGRGIIGVGQHYNHVCYPVSYVMVNDNGLEQDPQMMTNHMPLPPIPVPSSLESLMLSSSVPNSYLMYQPSTMTMQPPSSLPPSPPPPPPLSTPPQPSTQTIGCGTTQYQYDQSLNDYDHSGTTNLGNARIDTREIITTNSSPYVCDLQSEDRTVAAGMTSTVINNSILSQQHQLSNNDQISETTSSSHTTKMKAANEIKNPNIMTVDDNKVVGVCKQTILSAISKIIADNYESALYKLRKIIRVLDILMFNESGRGIGTAKLETVRPWWETMKDMERLVSVKHSQKNNNHSSESVLMRAECSYRYQVPQKSCYHGSGSNANSGNVHRIWRKSNNRRYRTTGKLIAEQCRHYLDRHRYCWINN